MNIVGGCCGTTPDHIAAISRAVAALPPRDNPKAQIPKPKSQGELEGPFTQLSGLETLTIRPESNFLMIGERTNVTGSKRVRPRS